MNIPEIKSYEEQAIDTVVSVINRAKEKLGVRQTLRQLASEYQTIYFLLDTDWRLLSRLVMKTTPRLEAMKQIKMDSVCPYKQSIHSGLKDSLGHSLQA